MLHVSVPRALTQVIKFCIEMVLTHVLHAIDAIRTGHLTNGSFDCHKPFDFSSFAVLSQKHPYVNILRLRFQKTS